MMADPSVNTDTGERMKPSGWSTDDPGTLAPGGGSILRKGMSLIEQREAAGKEEEQALIAKQKAESPYQKKLQEIYASPVTAHAELKKLQEAPRPEDYKKYTMEFLGAMALVGAFAGKGSRNHGNAALKAFTGAMNGWQQGNLEAYTQATKQWEENAKATIQANQVELQRYREVIENKELNIEQLKAGMLLAGMEAGNQAMIAHLRANNTDAAIKDFSALVNADAKLQRSTGWLGQQHATNEKTLVQQASEIAFNGGVDAAIANGLIDGGQRHHWQWILETYGPDTDIAKRVNAGGKRNPDDAKEIVKGIKEGRLPPTTTGLYGAGPEVKAEAVRQGVDLATMQLEYDAAKKQILSLNGPQMTRFVGLARSVQSTIDRVKDLSKQMQLGGIPAFNAVELQRYIQTQGNSPNGRLATKYMTDVNTLKEEFANLANGGYAPTEPAWKLADQQINGNYGVYQLSDSLDEVKRLIGYRLNAIPGIEKLGPGAPNRYTGEKGGAAAPEGAGDPSKMSDEEIRAHIKQRFQQLDTGGGT